MIAYDLQCSNNHRFEGWFEDEKSYRNQKKRDLLACPVCNDTGVSRIPSAFSIKSAPLGGKSKSSASELDRIGRQVADYVEKIFDNVGADFAKEALKMHFGVAEPRNIRATSAQQEETPLKEAGIEFFKIPLPSSSKSDS